MLRRLCSRAPRTISRSFTSIMLCAPTDSFVIPPLSAASPRRPAVTGIRVGGMSPDQEVAAQQLDQLRALVAGATSRLLGDTIAVTDEDWRGPSRLPDWTRGHLASHLAQQADGLGRLAAWAASGEPQAMYSSPEARSSAIEDGARRTGCELQIDLDTSAQHLYEAFARIDPAGAWDAVVELRGGLRMPARMLPLARLLEVVIHHVDLDLGFEIDQIDQLAAEWLLEWSAFRLSARVELPKLQLVAESGFTIVVGTFGDPIQISGTSQNLLGWLMNRLDSASVHGGEGLRLPAL